MKDKKKEKSEDNSFSTEAYDRMNRRKRNENLHATTNV